MAERTGAAAAPVRNWLRRSAVATAAGALWVLAVVDAKIADLLGVHLFNPYVLRVLSREGSLRDLALGSGSYVSATAAAVVIGLAHLPLLALLERRLERRWTARKARATAMALVIAAPLL